MHSSRKLTDALIVANEANDYSRSVILKGSTRLENNKLDQTYFDALVVGIEGKLEPRDFNDPASSEDTRTKLDIGIRDMVKQVQDDMMRNNPKKNPTLAEFQANIYVISKYSLGNCWESTLLSLYYILNASDVDAEAYTFSGDVDHAYVVLNKNPDNDPTNPETWGNNAVIEDSWAGIVFKASEYRDKLKNFRQDGSYKLYLLPVNDAPRLDDNNNLIIRNEIKKIRVPTLIMYNNYFFVYGLSKTGDNILTQLKDNDLNRLVKINYNKLEMTVSPYTNPELYKIIGMARAHIYDRNVTEKYQKKHHGVPSPYINFSTQFLREEIKKEEQMIQAGQLKEDPIVNYVTKVLPEVIKKEKLKNQELINEANQIKDNFIQTLTKFADRLDNSLNAFKIEKEKLASINDEAHENMSIINTKMTNIDKLVKIIKAKIKTFTDVPIRVLLQSIINTAKKNGKTLTPEETCYSLHENLLNMINQYKQDTDTLTYVSQNEQLTLFTHTALFSGTTNMPPTQETELEKTPNINQTPSNLKPNQFT